MSSLSENEINLLTLLVRKNLSITEIEEVKNLMKKDLNWELLLGSIVKHKIIGPIWKNISSNYLKTKFSDYYFILAIKSLYLSQRNAEYEKMKYLFEIANLFKENNIRYSLLKGIILSKILYQDIGIRSSNDIDILVSQEDIKRVSRLLEENSYVQGYYSYTHNKVIEATRKEKILSTITLHEVYPFVKVTNSTKFIDFVNLDLQFSLDIMTANRTKDLVDSFLNNSINIKIIDNEVSTLNWNDHFIFLCIHFYKEATNYNEIKEQRDLKLYKLTDIHYILNHDKIRINWGYIRNVIEKSNFSICVSFTLEYYQNIFNDLNKDALKMIDSENSKIDIVYSSEGRKYIWKNNDIIGRFFDNKRLKYLVEI